MREEFEPNDTDHQLVKDLYEIWDHLNQRTMLEDWHDAEQIREEALDLSRTALSTYAHVPRLKVCTGAYAAR